MSQNFSQIQTSLANFQNNWDNPKGLDSLETAVRLYEEMGSTELEENDVCIKNLFRKYADFLENQAKESLLSCNQWFSNTTKENNKFIYNLYDAFILFKGLLDGDGSFGIAVNRLIYMCVFLELIQDEDSSYRYRNLSRNQIREHVLSKDPSEVIYHVEQAMRKELDLSDFDW